MSRDGSGNYGLPAGNPVTTNTVISSTWANTTLSDIASALTQSISKDGQTTPTANLSMGNFRLISLAAGTNRTDAINVGQVQDNTPAVLSSIAGTGDAITAATAPAIVSYATDSKFVYTPTSTNTLTNPTIAIDGLAAKTITQSNGLGLWSGALAVGTPYELLYDGTNFRVQSGVLANLLIQQSSQTGFRNRIVDGNMLFWTGGLTFNFTAAGTSFGYTADVWMCSCGTGGSAAATVSLLGAFSPGTEPAGSSTPTGFVLSLNQTSAASVQAPYISNRFEDVSSAEGRSQTLSMWLYTASGTQTITTVTVGQVFGTGGSPSASVTTNYTVNWVVTTTPQRFSVRLDVPSIAGKTLGTDPNSHFFVVSISLPLSATYTINTFQWQLEDCPAGAPSAGLPTPFENRPKAVERLIVERYYLQRSVSTRCYLNANGQTTVGNVSYPSMRISPATTLITTGTRSGNISSAAMTAVTNGARLGVTCNAAGETYALGDVWAFDARL